MIRFDVGVVLPAAGSGNRFEAPAPKQYCQIWGHPLFLYALEGFHSIPWIKKIALVVDDVQYVKGILQENGWESEKVVIVQGDSTRHRSIKVGLKELKNTDAQLKVLIVHDAVRPFISPSFVEELVLAAEKFGAAGSTRPLVSTVIQSDNEGFLDKVLDRSMYLASETPQAFQTAVLNEAYDKCNKEDLDNGTECLQLALMYAGVRARLIPGPSDLWKVTYKKDLHAAIGCIKEKKKICITGSMGNDITVFLRNALQHQIQTVQYFVNTTSIVNEENEPFDIIIFIDSEEICKEKLFFNLLAKANFQKQAFIIHVIKCIEDANTLKMSHFSNGYSLHSEGVNPKLVIMNFKPCKKKQLLDLIAVLVTSDISVYSGQTFYL